MEIGIYFNTWIIPIEFLHNYFDSNEFIFRAWRSYSNFERNPIVTQY